MTRNDIPTPEALRALLAYDPATGALTWRPRDAETLASHGLSVPADLDQWNARCAGTDAAHTDDGQGYRTVSIASRSYKAQRIAWAIHHGAWPAGQVRFVGPDRSDLRISNLRVPSPPRPRGGMRVDNRSGQTGVHWRRAKSRWRARISVDGERVELGEFARFRDAVLARREAEVRYVRAAVGELQ